MSDDARDKPIEGAAVVVQCTCIDEEIVVMTNARGIYRVEGLPAGVYTVQALYNDLDGSRVVEVGRGQKMRANLALGAGRRVDDDERTLIVTSPIDPSRTGTRNHYNGTEITGSNPGATITSDVYDKLIALSPTATEGPGGRMTVNGNSDLEQRYELNNHDVGDPTIGGTGAQVIGEFIDSAEVIESGYDAEYGSASGGQFRARRVTGTNSFRGQVGVRFSPRLAAPRFVVATDEALRVVQVPDYGGAVYGIVSGPLVRDRLFYSVGINVAGARHSLIQSFYHRVDRDASGGYTDCPYENGSNDCVADGNYIATEKFAEQKFRTGGLEIGWLGGLDWRLTPRHGLALTVTGGPSFSRTSYRLPFSFDPVAFGNNPDSDPLGGSARIATGIVNDHFGTDLGIRNLIGLEYHGRMLDDRMEVDAQISYWRGSSQMAWRLDRPDQRERVATQEQSSGGRNLIEYLDKDGVLADIPGVEDACNDPDLPGNPCPVRAWVSGGLGSIERDLAQRVQGSVDVTHFLDARRAGTHQLKWGGEVAWLQRHSRYAYSGSNEDDFMGHACEAGDFAGGEYCYSPVDGAYSFDRGTRVNNHRYVVVNGDNPENRNTFGYGTVRHETGELRALANPLGRGVRTDAYDETLSTFNYAFYLQDRWAVQPNLVVSAGVRWEVQDMRDVFGNSRVLIWDNVGPRVGVTYDWTDEGRSRLYGSYGWFFQPLPLQLNSRVFGGLVQVGRSYNQNDCLGQSTTVDGATHQRLDDGGQPTEWCVDGNGFTTGLTEGAVQPGLKGPYNQQFQVGYEQEVIEDLVLGVRWVHQDLGRAVEDVSTNGGLNFLIANPGTGVDRAQIQEQQRTCDELSGQLGGLSEDDDRRGQLARELQRCEFLVDAFDKLGDMFPKPVRTMDAWTVHMTRRFAEGWSLRASYTYSRQVGNYDGYVDPSSGAVNLGASTQYDVPELVRNSFGPLSGTVPHMLNLDGIYSFDFRQSGRLTFGANLRMRSGRPVDVRADSTLSQYQGSFLNYLLPRGKGGRIDPSYRVNLTMSYAYPLSRDLELEFIARVLNVTNAKAVLRIDDVYSFDAARPIAGGDLDDLRHAKIRKPGGGDGFFERDIVKPQGNFAVETRFQQGRAYRCENTRRQSREQYIIGRGLKGSVVRARQSAASDPQPGC
ncbi:MAG: TonB-dependent receptor [Myxococcales bacterium]|nr:TonB-dependent receptor [Myxococcales bacterium]